MYPQVVVGEGLVPSRVCGNQNSVITTDRHKTGPYDVVAMWL
jgi:hypothetical protein